MHKRLFLLLGLLPLTAACGQILGIDDFTDEGQGGNAGTGGGGSGATGGSTGGTGGSTGGTGGMTGGMGGTGGGITCVPMVDTQPCYTGDPLTQDVGLCQGGIAKCNAEGTGYGPCEGEVLPAPEMCGGSEDEDCDGSVNEEGANCLCVPNTKMPCYTGPAPTQNVGLCKNGDWVCDSTGQHYGPCEGEVLPAVEGCGKAGDEDCDGSACSETVWAKLAGDGSSQKATGIATDAQGNIYVTGSFSGGMTFAATNLVSAGGDDIFLVKLDSTGTPIWAKQFGDPQAQYPGPVVVDGNGDIVIAGYSSTGVLFGPTAVTGVYVAKFAPDGTHVWSKGYGGGTTTRIAGAAVDATNNVLLAGEYSGNIDFGTGAMMSIGGLDSLLVKLNGTNGNGIWSKGFGDSANQRGRAVAVDAGGNVLFTSGLEGTVSFGGPTLMSMGAIDVVVAKYDGAGNHSWSKRFGDSGQQYPEDLSVDAMGNVYVTGHYYSTINFGATALTSAGMADMFVAKLTTSGNEVWAKSYGGTEYDASQLIHVDKNGQVVFSGYVGGSIDLGGGALAAGPNNIVMAKLSANGDHIWSRYFPGTGLHVPDDLTTNPANKILLAGYASGTIDFGLGPVTVGANSDAFFMMIDP